ncbi:PNPLA domain-containing protein [Meloidogyne graminicola]|uniref:PNPLA domain-containing protein n=1 Tax=Meloidogyne graminicola TaxID=189291 RepID=A0A8S9ZE92_9BILA|nr:PNPLA domain-containing protein [Meloidogyne graminicola]
MHPVHNPILNVSQMQLSFAGCGFLCIYHAGVCAAIKEYAPQLTMNKIKGASAGAIAAAGLVCNSQATSTILQIVTEARTGSLLALSPNFDVLALVREGLEQALPENARNLRLIHIICTGRLFLSQQHGHATIKMHLFPIFLLKHFFVHVLFLFYCGVNPPTYRGEQYIDGAFSDNQPGKWEPGTVSPFSGESDICPNDEDSASMFGFDVAGTSVQFTTQNLFRTIVILFPPAPEVCSRICRQGFEDALRFLTKNHLVPCIECLTIQSTAIPVSTPIQNKMLIKSLPKTEPFLKNNRIRILQKKRSSSIGNREKILNGCAKCLGPLGGRLDSFNFSSIPLPSVVQQTLTDMETRSAAGLLSWLRRWRLIRWWLRLILPPVMLPFELLQFALRKIRLRIKKSILAPAEAYILRFQHLVDFVLQQIENKYLAPSAVLPIGSPSLIQITEIQKNEMNKPENRKHSLVSQRKISASVEPLDLAIDNLKIERERNINDEENRNVVLRKLINEREDAVLSFHYREDETNELKICQIFDNSGRHLNDHHCHKGTICSPLESQGSDTEEFGGGEDSGLSLAEDEEDENSKNKKLQGYLRKNKKRI